MKHIQKTITAQDRPNKTTADVAKLPVYVQIAVKF